MSQSSTAKKEVKENDPEENTEEVIDIKYGKLLRLQQYFKSINEEIAQEIMPEIKKRHKVVRDIKKVVGNINGSFKQNK